jgi:hypothetical protein
VAVDGGGINAENTSMIYGRVDEMRSGKVFGWAFDSSYTDDHLEVTITRGSDVVARGQANLHRSDLPDAGVGRGDHAFEIILPPNISSFHGLVIVARSTKSGDAPLPIATNDDRHLDDLFHIFAKRYDGALAALKTDLDRLHDSIGNEQIVVQPEPIFDAAYIDERFAEFESRFEELQVFVMRLDEITKILQDHVARGKRRGLFSRIFGKSA